MRARVLQVRVSENHQNGKDTHVRGIQVFAKDERVKAPHPPASVADDEASTAVAHLGANEESGKISGPTKAMERLYVGEEPDWMGEPEIR